ncbi:MAG: trypsin-like peptidase domain-containing protein [Planctomycetes bacterium]|nr:trypsin-like peptidase domain-containing protein [Planctomycetota bacterium]
MRRFPYPSRLACLVVVAVFGSMQYQIWSLQRAVVTARGAAAQSDERLRAESDLTGRQIAAFARQVALADAQRRAEEERQRGALTGLERAISLGMGRIEKGMRRDTARLESAVGSCSTVNATLADKVVTLAKNLRGDPAALARDLLAPTVQVRGNGGVGAGTLVYSGASSGAAFRSYVLTAFHVVAKSVTKDNKEGKEGAAGKDETREPVRVRVFRADLGTAEEIEADLISYDEAKDIAVLKLRSDREFTQVAHLASRETIRSLALFNPVYAVGCPLGHNPMPSPGEITSMTKELNGQRFWMMSAPTIYGNSGGGVYLASGHELIGLSSMICVYDNFISLPVPHLGILVPLDSVYDWFDTQCLQFLYRRDLSKEDCDRDRLERRKTQPLAVQLTWDF